MAIKLLFKLGGGGGSGAGNVLWISGLLHLNSVHVWTLATTLIGGIRYFVVYSVNPQQRFALSSIGQLSRETTGAGSTVQNGG